MTGIDKVATMKRFVIVYRNTGHIAYDEGKLYESYKD